MDPAQWPALLPVLIPVFFVSLWTGACHLVAVVGGWKSLADSYASTDTFEGKQLWWRHGRFNHSIGYNGCLNLGAGARGLHLSVMVLFRLGHAPLLIPWSDITLSESRFWLVKSTTFSFSRVPTVQLHLRPTLAQKLLQSPGVPALRTRS
jgi:hypothetical protein